MAYTDDRRPRIDSGVVPGEAIIWTPAKRDELELRCLLGDAPPALSGFGGHVYRERRKRPPLTIWEGPSGRKLTLALVLENRVIRTAKYGLDAGEVAGKLRVLTAMAGGEDEQPSPVLRVKCNLPHLDAKAAALEDWVIERDGLELGRQVYSDRGTLIVCEATVTLLRVAATGLERLRKSDPFRRVTMRKGETLRTFARRTLGDARRWRDVAALNRDDPKCPSSAERKIGRDHPLKVPPREAAPQRPKGRR